MNQSIISNKSASVVESYPQHDEGHSNKTWEATIIEAFELANPTSRISNAPKEWSLAEVVWPVVEMVMKPVFSYFDELVRHELVAPTNVRKIFNDLITPLWKTIFEAVSRSITVELAAAKETDLLPGETDIERYDFFIDCLKDPEFSLPLITQWPPLCELVVAICENWKTSTISFLTRLQTDWPAINCTFIDNKNTGVIKNITASQGDTHRHGHSVAIVELESGKKFVYKPRSVATEYHFGSFALWVNDVAGENIIKHVIVIERKNYGWCEYISHSPIKSKPALHRYHKRLGILLAIARVLRITDLHSENIVADGEWPVLIDLEAIFHPLESDLRPQLTLTSSERKLSATLAKSVQSTGLLPTRSFNELATKDSLDLAGMADVEGKEIPFNVPSWENVGTDEMRLGEASYTMDGNHNIPVYLGKRIKAEEFKEDIKSGFRLGHSILANEKQKLAAIDGPLKVFWDDKVRIVLRATQFYTQLLTDGSHPDLLYDFDKKTSWLKSILGTKESSYIEQKLSSSELSAFWRNDVPYFETTPLSRNITDCSDLTHNEILPESGWSTSRKIIENLDDNDLDFQLWLIDAALCEHQNHKTPTLLKSEDPKHPPLELKEHAHFIANTAAREVCKFATIRSGQGSWLTLKETEGGTLAIIPAELDLYSGLPGIALFLAKAGNYLETPKYKKVGRAALEHIMLKLKNDEANDLSCGGYTGTGGLIFALSHLLSEYPDLPILKSIHKLVHLTSESPLEENSVEVVDGLAGLSLSLVSAINNLSNSTLEAQIVIDDMTTLLFDTCIAIQQRIELDSDLNVNFDNSNGIAHGLQGLKAVISVLLEFPNADIQISANTILSILNKYDDIKIETQDCCGTSTHSIAWCRGLCGDLLGEVMIHGSINQSLLVTIFNHLRNGYFIDDSMCHGSMGTLHFLNSLNHYLSSEQQNELHEIMLLILERAQRNNALSGTIGNVFSPGFMDGFSGIGFAALSILEPDSIPMALTLGVGFKPQSLEQ